MPSTSALTAEEKSKVKSAIPAATNKIFFATIARIYYAYPQPHQWSYAGLQGALAFVLDSKTNITHFKLVDLDGTRGVIWEHELYNDLELHQDRPFFHTFASDVSASVIPLRTRLTLSNRNAWLHLSTRMKATQRCSIKRLRILIRSPKAVSCRLVSLSISILTSCQRK